MLEPRETELRGTRERRRERLQELWRGDSSNLVVAAVPVAVVRELNLDVQVMIGLDQFVCRDHTYTSIQTHTHTLGWHAAQGTVY